MSTYSYDRSSQITYNKNWHEWHEGEWYSEMMIIDEITKLGQYTGDISQDKQILPTPLNNMQWYDIIFNC